MVKKRTLVPRDSEIDADRDKVMTPFPLARSIIEHYKPIGRILDPCRGEGAFYDQFVRTESYHVIRDWCEIAQGRDFLAWSGDWDGSNKARHFDWVISNPPWSQYRAFTQRAMQVSDNVVWLCLVNAVFMKARLRDMKEARFGLREIAFVDTPPPPWPQTGFALSAVHIQRGYVGDIKTSHISIS